MSRLGIAAAVTAIAAAAGSVATWGTERATPTSNSAGSDLFMSKGCAGCHNGPQSTARVPAGPSLASAADWAGERRRGVSAHAYLEESMVAPSAFISPDFSPNGPTTVMPTLNLTTAEIDLLVDFLLAG